MTMLRNGKLVALVCLSLTAGSRSMAADAWIEVISPNFTVVSDAGEKSARNVAWQFEQIRSAIEQAWPWSHVQLDRPMVVIAARNEATMRLFDPGDWERGIAIHPAGVAVTGVDRSYIVVRADVTADGPEGVNPYHQSFWTYAHLTLSSAFTFRLPLWFTRGLSEVLSNTNVTDKEIQFGRSIPWDVSEFKGGRYALTELFDMRQTSPAFSREIERRRFDAQAWGLMHYMLFGSKEAMARESRVNMLAQALLSGTPSAQAVEQAFGPLPALDFAYREYVNRGLFRYVQFTADMRIAAKDFALKPIDAAGVLTIRAGFHLAMQRPAEARQAIDEARRLAPQLAAIYDAEGQLFDRDSTVGEARRAYEQAVRFGSTDFYSYTRLAALSSEGATQDLLANVRGWLLRAVELNDRYPLTYQWLCNILLRMSRPGEALAPARKAVELGPGQFQSRLSLAEVLERLSQRDEALQEARAALALASTDSEHRSAQVLINRLQGLESARFQSYSSPPLVK